ncbi:hypothetical protein SPI_03013 [Niveomyces insectorum RCEF 264]|uniref:Uncharacterized protein n=1 Tax=Niveomyces insectorum RCEF 264 TaxID=1081102 RepID=A0A167WZY8_9HYPO|nr:hypothetical protein SPI_03013 [Niveomyces insectorum RCEF 264]
MVIGLLAIAGIPTTIGVCEALSAQKKQDAAQKEKAKFHLTAELSIDGGSSVECFIVLKDGKLYIDHPDAPAEGHKFKGFYFTYPTEKAFLGLVSTIADDPPMLNWIFLDKDTSMMKHAGRKDTIGHLVGPWGWSDDEKWLTFRGSEAGFVAVRDPDSNKWNIGLLREGEEIATGHQEVVKRQRQRQVTIMLRRRMELGLDSQYVRDGER